MDGHTLFADLHPDVRRELRRIVKEWLAEGIDEPPYSSAVYDIIEALNLDSAEHEDPVWDYDTRRPT